MSYKDSASKKYYSYEMSEKLFMDIWERYGRKKEILDKDEIYSFLNEIVTNSKGLIILDHFSNINYDRIEKVEYKKPYICIYWKDLNNYREKYLNKTLSDGEDLNWSIFGYATYSYIMMDIKKIKIVNKKKHLYLLVLPNLISTNNIQKELIGKKNALIHKESNKNELYTEYVFWEGDKKNAIKHICIVSNLPYYTCLIQAKERCTANSGISKDLLLYSTFEEIYDRVKKVHCSIESLDEYDHDELFAKGNTIRRIIEYTLKYLCIYKGIEIEGKDLEDNYGDILLGKLKKTINKSFEELNINQSFIKMANELSHDSGVVFSKNEVSEFCNTAKELIKQIEKIVLRDEEF